MKIVQLPGQQVIAFQCAFIRLTGSAMAALMLSQAFYWAGRTTDQDGWFWKTAKQWQEETGLSRREQETARKRLRSLGLLEERRRGIPAKMSYRVDMERLQASLAESAKADCAERTNKIGEKRRAGMPESANHFIETTTKNTLQDTPLETTSSLVEKKGEDHFFSTLSPVETGSFQCPKMVQDHVTRDDPAVRPTQRGKKPGANTDPRHGVLRAAIENYYRNINGTECPWDGRAGKNLNALLRSVPLYALVDFQRCLDHRAQSSVNHADMPHRWVADLPKYNNGPLNKYGQLKTEDERNGKESGQKSGSYATTRVTSTIAGIISASQDYLPAWEDGAGDGRTVGQAGRQTSLDGRPTPEREPEGVGD